jgi:alcohol dehydrogenase (cytochrome c)
VKIYRKFSVALVAVVAVVVIAACGGSSSKSKTTTTASASLAVQSETPGDQWLSVGGSLMHENYSPLSQINTTNISSLKGVWLKHLGTATSAIYSAEGQSVYENGVLYISTGSDNVFAYNAISGKLIWHYAPNPAIPLSYSKAVCCGWDNRAVGVGGGLVYIAQINGDLVALNQKTGKTVWSTSVGSPKDFETMTLPVTYYNGRVYAGVSGADYEVRGFIAAFNAKTGKQEWKFWNTAGPNQANGNTWAGKSALTAGGASTWNAPSIDPKTDTMYYSTGNAGDDFDGRLRAGKDLYTSSIIALNASTGKLKWYYQEVHHDIWDYDAPSETVLFNPTIHGKVEPAIAQPGKTGMLYVLNRNTGKPLYPTPEKPVVQNPQQHTWPTQPESPLVFSPQKVTPATMAVLTAAAKATSPAAAKLDITPGKNFTGLSVVTDSNTVQANPNGASGGNNWEPSSYDPSNDYYYTCSLSGAQAFVNNTVPAPVKVGTSSFEAVKVAAIAGFATPGYLTAFNLNTGKVAWQDQFKSSCYSGTVDTAGGLVFVGQNSGQLQAYNAKTGKLLWSFQTGAGANAPVSVFKDQGKEYVALYAGGSDLAGASHGDNYWLFGLNGKLKQVAAGATAVAGKHGGTSTSTSTSKPETAAQEIKSGKTIFVQNCGGCHRLADANSAGNEGPNLDQLKPSDATVTHQVINGGGAMPAFGKSGQLSTQQITDVAKYVSTVAGKK